MLDVTVRGSEDLRSVARALRKADREDLHKGLAKAIREGARPVLNAVQDSARDIHTVGQRKPGARHPFTGVVAPKGTRRKIAAAVVADVKVEEEDPRVRFRVAEAKLPPELKNMPRKFDGGKWRHPIMGNREAWVGQTSQPWFWPPIRDHIGEFRKRIEAELIHVREEIERAA